MSSAPLPRLALSRLLAGAALLAGGLGVGGGVILHFALASPTARPTRALGLPALYGQAVWSAGRKPAPAFALRDQNDRRISLAAERGHDVVLAFMDPLCRQECPFEGRALALTMEQLLPAERPALLIVSVNPQATAAQARAASRRWGFVGDVHWLLGHRAELSGVWRDYKIDVIPTKTDIIHSTAVYVIDRRGFERAGVLAPFLPQFVADDLRTLTREPA